jgi:hypothetical protein
MLGSAFISSLSSGKAKNFVPKNFGTKFQKKQLLRLLGVPLLEPFNAARGIDKLLRAGKERMALGADADTHVFSRGTRLENVPARAVNHRVNVFWMYLGFHGQGRETYTTKRPVASRICGP